MASHTRKGVCRRIIITYIPAGLYYTHTVMMERRAPVVGGGTYGPHISYSPGEGKKEEERK